VFDGRWYIAPTIGGMYNETDRNTNSRQFYGGLGVGKFISPNVSIEGFADSSVRRKDAWRGGGHWGSEAVGVSGRFFPGNFVNWRPYVMAGVLGSYHWGGGDNSWSPAAQLGVGLSKVLTKNVDLRLELGYRYDLDDKSQSQYDGYGDWLLGLSAVIRFGEPPAAPAPVVAAAPPPPPDCSTLDDDNDGVNNCDDKCPGTAAGTIVGPDGCAKPVVIDLRGVNFKFDRPKPSEHNIGPTLQEPTADSIAILDQAVDTLTRYPAVQVELDGHTDSIGTEAYNQKLSERRAQIVDDYLTSHGIDASRITAVKGFGEDKPIDTNKTKEGRARNRRTELVVQNPGQPAAAGDSAQ
jgi:OOP family OmpA-OmpF porin